MKPWWTKRLAAFATLSLAIVVLPFTAHADISGGLQNGYSDNFDYPGVAPGQDAPLDPTRWQTMPVASNGASLAGVWMVGDVNTSGTGTSSVLNTASNTKALKETTTGFNSAEPIAFVRGGDWQNLVVQATGAFTGTPSIDSGIGIVFKAPVDPITGLADKNNYYLFSGTYSPRTCALTGATTNNCFVLIKRVGGAFFISAVEPTYLNLTENNGQVSPHVYKVIMTGDHIMCFVDGQLVISVHDTPSNDGTKFTMPGPMFSDGTVGVRTSKTKAWFNDFTVMGNSLKASEGRAAGLDSYGQVGAGSNGIPVQLSGADTGFQYNDHDFNATPSQALIAPVSPSNGIVGGAQVSTVGVNGVVTSTAQLLGFSGLLTQTLPDGTNVNVNLMSDSISALATASCAATSGWVQLQNLTYLITINNKQGVPLVEEGKVTQVNPPPNTTVIDPVTNGNYVKITLNSQMKTLDPMRTDITGVRIDFLQPNQSSTVMAQGKTVADSGITYATVNLANVVAGRYCTSSF